MRDKQVLESQRRHGKTVALVFFVVASILVFIQTILTVLGAPWQNGILLIVGAFISLGFAFYYLRHSN